MAGPGRRARIYPPREIPLLGFPRPLRRGLDEVVRHAGGRQPDAARDELGRGLVEREPTEAGFARYPLRIYSTVWAPS